MPASATRPELPPAELSDRSEGLGSLGQIVGYADYRDDGVWPGHQFSVRDEEPSETLDGTWYRVQDQGSEGINNYQGQTYQINAG